MKNICIGGVLSQFKTQFKINRAMKLTCALLFTASMGAFASGNAQSMRVNIKVDNASTKEILSEIEKQTDYLFVYNKNEVDLDRKASVNAENETTADVLSAVFDGTDIVYAIEGENIMLMRKEEKMSNVASQQDNRITGTIVDATGLPIIGANVMVKGTTNGTITDMDGKFTLDVPAGAVLQISYIGYANQEVKVGKSSNLSITLKEDTELLDEVVVVGFGSQKKANLTGAVSTVKMDEALGDRPLVQVADALQGQVPGLLVNNGGNAPGQGKSFQIRGAYSIGSGSVIAPLVLIDNVEGDMNMLNPDDIESVTVLKDAASSAIYGARAAGGVILITTKRPKEKTKFQLNYNNNFAFASAMNLPKQAPLETYLNAYMEAEGDQFWTMGSPSVSKWLGYLEQYRNDPGSINVVGDGIYKDEAGGVYYLNEKDLVRNMMETSFQHTHNLSVSGATDKLRYRMSAGFVGNDGVLITNKDSYTRMNVNSFISADITDWFTQEANLSYAHSNKQLPSSALGAIYGTRLASFYPEGTMPEGISDGAEGLPFFTPANQIKWSNPSKTLNDNPRIFLKSIIKPIKNLEVVFEYTFDKKIYDYSWYTGSVEYTTVQGGRDTTPTSDHLDKTKSYTNYNAINLYGTYSFDIAKDHHFKLMAGFNQESSYKEQVAINSYNQAVIDIPSLSGGEPTMLKAVDSYTEFAVRGGFFRVNYNYKDKYLFEANGRYDGSSKFPKSNRFGFFPSASVGWNIAQESFMEKTQDWLGMLKLRASYGVIGNQNISAYAFVPDMSISNKYNGWLVDNSYVVAINSLPSLVSTTFTWEKVATTNVGLDFSLFNNRLSGLFEWFQRDTRGMLAPGMQLPAVVGASAPTQNTADMRTRGWEFNINWRDKIGDFGYRVGFNLSDAQSEIVKYDSNESKMLDKPYVGKKMGELWGYVYDGFYTVDDFVDTKSWKLKDGVTAINGVNPRPGDIKFKNLRDDDQGENLIYAGNGTYDNPGDRKIIGNTTPRYLYGITLGGNYKGLDLNIFLQGTGKRDAWLANNLVFPLYTDYKFIALYDGLDNYWRPVDAAGGDYTCANPDAEFPRIYGNYGNQGSNYRMSDRYLSDASYMRIKNVTLSYTFPKHLIQKVLLSNLKAFVSVENLATFSSLPNGIDPETLNWNYPAFRTVSFGINLSL